MNVISRLLASEGLFARAARGSFLSLFGFVGSQVIRLASNLILTRLLFPEAFGLMALVTVLTLGVMMLSEVGIGLSISQSKRGDEQSFLDTAWTIQVIRAACLGIILSALGWPAAQLYQEPLLAAFLPVAAIGLVIGGFVPMRFESAARHMLLGRITMVDLLSQVISTAVIILLAWLTGSVWSLIAGTIAGSAAKVILAHLLLPGAPSRFSWDPSSARELLHFGKWIFASTAFGFVLAQGDRMILGAYLSMDLFGIYNIAQFLATAPMLIASAAIAKVIIPLYREAIGDESESIRRRLTKVRFFLTGGTILLQATVALAAIVLVNFMYDDRYASAGPIAVLIALSQLPLIVGMTYDRAALAAADARGYFFNLAFRTVLQTTLFVVGAELAGLPGALVGQIFSGILGHAGNAWLAWKNRLWDPWHDLAYGALALALGALVLWLNWSSIAGLHVQ